MIDIVQDAIALLNALEDGYMPGLAYDTAWAAMIPEHEHSKKPMFPKSLLWLITAQHDDGSWGAQIEYYYDRLISTLASIIAFKKTHKSEKFKEIIENGEDYIWYNIKGVRSEPQETVSFEILFPALMNEAEHLGLNLPYREKFFEPLKEKKLKLAISELIALKNSTVTFSLEFLGEYASENLLRQAQNVNGSISNSPSATSFLLTKFFNENAYNYLNRVLDFNSGSSMTLYPFDVFETAWVIEYFQKAGIPIEEYYNKKLKDLAKLWTEKGISMSKFYYSEDLDDSTTVYNILKKSNQKVDIKVFKKYESTTHFNCYPSELSPSPLVNIKVLNLLKQDNEYPEQHDAVEKIIKFLYKERVQQAYWIDKWNISPYYCTGLALEAIEELDPKLSNNALDWLIKTQNFNGSWGNGNGNLEETSYAIQALIHYHENVEKIDTSIIYNGLKNLEYNYHINFYPELWLGKGLYCPFNVVKASVLAALYLGKKFNQ